ncbi:MAG: glycosyltransferase family 1 protein [bacterium]|nr:glycosyltransferase family 1 protein [bacterium]
MHVAVDIRLLTTGKTTGVEEYTRALIDALLRRADGHHYTLVYNGLVRAPLPARWLNHPKARVVTARIPNKFLDAALWLTYEPHLGRFCMEPPDLVYSPHLNIVAPPPGVPRVMTIHDLSFRHYPEFVLLRRRLWNWFQAYEARARSADAVVAVSEFTRRDVIETLGVASERVHAIYPGRNSVYRPYAPHDPELAVFRTAHPEFAAPFILTVGTVEPRKNHRAAIRAFAALKRNPAYRALKLVIAGQWGWKYGTIRKEAAVTHCAADILWWRTATERELRTLYTLARVMVYPSWFEGFGFPPLEAMACGTPVVTSNRSSLPEVVGEAALTVSPWDPAELAAAIAAVFPDGPLRDRFIAAGFRNIDRFDWDRTADQLVSLFESLVVERKV